VNISVKSTNEYFWLMPRAQMGATDNKNDEKQRLIPKLTADSQNGDSTTVKESESERLARINKGGGILNILRYYQQRRHLLQHNPILVLLQKKLTVWSFAHSLII
jgi:hypothetical protein